MTLEEEKTKVLKTIKDKIDYIITDDNILTHDMLVILIHEAKGLIKSDF